MAEKSSSEEMQALKDDLKELRNDFGELLGALRGEGGEKLADLRDRMKDRAETAGRRMSDSASDARRTLEEHPFSTAVTALCVGLITGAILGGNRH